MHLLDGRWQRALSWSCIPRNNCFITWMSYLELSWCFCAFTEPVPLDSKEELYVVWKTQGSQSLKVLGKLELLLFQSKQNLKDKVQGLYSQYRGLIFSTTSDWQLQTSCSCLWPSDYRCKMGIVKMVIAFHLTIFIWFHFWIKSFLFLDISSLAHTHILHTTCQYLQIYLIKLDYF